MNGFIFFFYFNVTTRKQILNLYMFIFLETQETGALPKQQRGFYMAWYQGQKSEIHRQGEVTVGGRRNCSSGFRQERT